jgi:hypothetical protein
MKICLCSGFGIRGDKPLAVTLINLIHVVL